MKFQSLLARVLFLLSNSCCEAVILQSRTSLSRVAFKATSHDSVRGSESNVTIPVKLPAGWLPGAKVTVKSPDGHTLTVNVPGGLSAGDIFQYTYVPGAADEAAVDATDADDNQGEKGVKDRKEDEEDNLGDDEDQSEKDDVDSRVSTTWSTVEVEQAPFSYLYTESDKVAHDTELRYRPSFFPEGTHRVDMGRNDVHDSENVFTQEPSPFANCLMIRDYAMPLRVGTSLQELSPRFLLAAKVPLKSATHEAVKHAQHQVKRRNGKLISLRQVDSAAQKNENNSTLVANEDEETDDDDDDEADTQEEPSKLPDSMLIMKGGVMDRDVTEEESGNDTVELAVNMFAFLQSVSGEVRVVPHGTIAKWSSKRKVPIAGYLCTEDTGPVLYTLETPCLHTVLGPDGVPLGVPPTPKNDTTDTALELNRPHKLRFSLPVGVAEDVATDRASDGVPAPAPTSREGDQYEYKVWVGNTKLGFMSKLKADNFCRRLTERIASDLGDSEWDAAKLPEVGTLDREMKVDAFVQMARTKTQTEWTLGKKSLLVVVMDWEAGDASKAPNSQQTQTPQHYESKIFPRVREAFRQMSYGQFDVEPTFVPEVVRYTRQRSRYAAESYPFPGLYNGAKESLEGNAKYGQTYRFDDYELVYVIAPQQAPVGTKGVAWVGAKGAMCNGCEAISENFQVMVAVHELGHNLGLFHASSTSLEYGNVFDWMGNYPDVEGLSYGLGYKMSLKWVPRVSVQMITDEDLPTLNDQFALKPYDGDALARDGEVFGLQVSLNDNTRDIFVSFRQTAGANAGVYIVMQDKDKPNSELVDCGCHTPSQQDARLQEGWTYVDPSSSVVIVVKEVTSSFARVHIYKAPGASQLAAIRARAGFTDGVWKCPRTCTDSDLLVSMYNGCSTLAQDGYCNGGAISMSGSKYTISTDLCPQSCDTCTALLSESTEKAGGCQDRNIKISGKSCSAAAAGGFCDYSTTSGPVSDLCPASCGKCPRRVTTTASSATFKDPTPVRTHGSETSSQSAPAISPAVEAQAEAQDEARKEERAEGPGDGEEDDADEDSGSSSSVVCQDDPMWTDDDGDSCKKYEEYIAQGTMTQSAACRYGSGQANTYCRKTCGQCPTSAAINGHASEIVCADLLCVTKWHHDTGKCFSCSDHPIGCMEEHFRHDCPLTCGLCKAGVDSMLPATTQPATMVTTTTKTTTAMILPEEPPAVCEDHECVDHWLKETGDCHHCADFAEDYCGRDEAFMKACPRSCKTCHSDKESTCRDDFLPHTCDRYRRWGWCSNNHGMSHCKSTCGVCATVEAERAEAAEKFRSPTKSSASSSHVQVLMAVFFGALVIF